MSARLTQHQRLLLQALKAPASVMAFGNAEWELLLRMAQQAKLLGSLAVALDSAGLLKRTPTRVQQQLVSSQVEIKNLQRKTRWELNRISRAIDGSGIPVIVLKGAAYVFTALPSLSGRYFLDLDILVPGKDLERFEALLLEQGWNHPELSAYDEHYYRALSHEVPPFINKDRQIEVDVHHTLAPPVSRLKINADLLFGSAVNGNFSGASCMILCPVDMVLHCAVNLFQNNDLADDLRDLLDLDEMLRYFSAENDRFWTQLVERSNQLGTGKALFHGLQFSSLLLETPVPENVVLSLSQRPTRLSQWLMYWLVPAVLFPMQPDNPSIFARLARVALFLRSHWIRMPPHLLLVHFAHKSFASLGGRSA